MGKILQQLTERAVQERTELTINFIPAEVTIATPPPLKEAKCIKTIFKETLSFT